MKVTGSQRNAREGEDDMLSYDSFMLRVWRHAGEDGSQWAGRLQHLPDGTTWTFRCPEELLVELARLVAATPSVTVRPPVPEADDPGSA
jgi:hypothetical protein